MLIRKFEKRIQNRKFFLKVCSCPVWAVPEFFEGKNGVLILI